MTSRPHPNPLVLVMIVSDLALIAAAILTGTIAAAAIIVVSTWLDRREERKWRVRGR